MHCNLSVVNNYFCTTMNLLLKLFVPAVAIMIAGYILDPHVVVSNFGTAIGISIVLALLNMFVKPILLILTIPVTIITLGLFLIILDALMIILADNIIKSGFEVDGIFWAIIFSFFISITSSILNFALKENPKTAED
jgi:putative membrane protein